ncbi:integrin alpha, partial [Crocosphaera watsonii]|uniref:integrin alpha n=1 Tax=Crocosphaera watsonii TaxID=263511 RepID=UPI000650D92E
ALNLSSLNGSNGFVINGIDARDYSGRSVSNAGDINGDGIDDIIIGAFLADRNGNSLLGQTYVVFGSESFDSTLNLSSLDGSNGFVISGIDARDYSGKSVSNAGDVNGDGIDDFIIGAYGAEPNGNRFAGETYVIFGSESFGNTLNLSSLDGNNGFVINGIDEFDNSGFSVSNAGDINGDGFDDLIIGAFFADPNGNEDAGETYVIFGSESFGSTLNLSSLNGNNGFVINGIDAGDNSGFSVSNAGDVNGDGIDDLIIGADPAEANGNSYAGQTYVIFGGQNNNSNSLLSVTAEVDSNSLTETPLVTDQGIETFFVEVKLDEPVTDLPGLIINYDVTGTATLGEDYYISQTDISTTDGSFPTNSIFIPQGADSANIYITPLADAIVEGDETIRITLQS